MVLATPPFQESICPKPIYNCFLLRHVPLTSYLAVYASHLKVGHVPSNMYDDLDAYVPKL